MSDGASQHHNVSGIGNVVGNNSFSKVSIDNSSTPLRIEAARLLELVSMNSDSLQDASGAVAAAEAILRESDRPEPSHSLIRVLLAGLAGTSIAIEQITSSIQRVRDLVAH